MQKYTLELSNMKNQRSNHTGDVISSLTAKINALKKLTSKQPGVLIIIDDINANQFKSALPDYATIVLSTFFNDKVQGDWVAKQVNKIAKKDVNNHIDIRIQTLGGRLPVEKSINNQTFYDNIQKLAQKLEIHTEAAHLETTSDVSFAGEGIPVIEGFGPLGGNCGSPDEFIIRDSLIDRAALLAMVLYHVSKK
jgi:acetylornithine deacetylase/succinyl-diaminopimelate desuccinylase-like protein